MAFSYGKKFRRLAAQALSADKAEMDALIARILSPRDGGKRELRLESYDDCRAAPKVVLAAFFADVIGGDEAVELLRQAENPPEAQQTAAIIFAALEPAMRMWSETARRYQAELSAQSTSTSGEPSQCSAATEVTALVNINENTSGAAHGDAQR